LSLNQLGTMRKHLSSSFIFIFCSLWLFDFFFLIFSCFFFFIFLFPLLCFSAFVVVIGMETETPKFNREELTLFPLALFEVYLLDNQKKNKGTKEPSNSPSPHSIWFTLHHQILHQQAYNSATFTDFRRKSTILENHIAKQTLALRSSVNDANYRDYSSKLRENEQTLRKEKEKWQASSWVFSLLEWHRANSWKSIFHGAKVLHWVLGWFVKLFLSFFLSFHISSRLDLNFTSVTH